MTGHEVSAASVHDSTFEEHHDPHLAHHFESMGQQFDASKLGMWLFLATEILLFGGLFCVYAIYRMLHPEIFVWGHHFLDRQLGGLNTLVLITSSFTMALAVRSAQLGQRVRLVVLLGITLIGAFGFLVIKYIEYKPKFEHGLLWGASFNPDPAYVDSHFGGGHGGPGHGGDGAPEAVAASSDHDAAPAPKGDVAAGKKIASETCAACHGTDLRGLPNNGLDLVTSEFVAGKNDDELLKFMIVGRQPFDPESRNHVAMPPRAGNPLLTDDRLRDVVAYLRLVQEEGKKSTPVQVAATSGEASLAVAAGSKSPDGTAPAVAVSTEPIPAWVIPLPPDGPPGLSEAGTLSPHAASKAAPVNAHHYFGIYFLLTGLHGIHVIAGSIVILWLMVRAMRGDFSVSYFGPVDLGGLYWHLVDLIWIFLFPLLYLIG